MNETSMVTSSKRRQPSGRSSGVSVPRVDAFEDDDARVAAQPPVELAVADVERDDACGAALQQDVGEAAGRRADVERRPCRPTSMPNASSACASFRPPRPTYG